MRKTAVLLSLLASLSFGEDLSYNRFFLVDRIFLMPFVFKYADDLGVDEEQMERIKAFVKENEREIERNIKILRYMEKKAKLMILNGEDGDKLRELLTDISTVKRELSLLNAKSVRFLKEVLTPEQFDRLRNIALVRLFEFQQ
ncbi:MAG TPA: hypothetical protein ENJ61_05960 [Aquifex aeolicus]|uniref:Periplasmic heavy metal sensor n=1 Tax=Aquifex aeolicus TaxID=63363 RepID=A0A7C5Q531_AQUAO|nr:hypothetical protein [Aquifex aeolicus]